MRYRDGRRSVCVSSQSGCPLTCTFCATGQMKFGRNLSADEILDQALHFRRVEAIDHVVFMGMGEPTMNIDNVLAACERLPDLGVTNRRTAISTVGWVPGIDRLAECELPVGLALSLHAPNDELRSQLMPVNDRYPLAEVLAACDRYRAKRRRKVFVEYVMLDGVNDLPEHARELAALLDPRVYKVNLIPYNPTGAYDGSSPERIERFRAILAEHRLTATVRLTRGRDIDAACGQLAATRLSAVRRLSRYSRDKRGPDKTGQPASYDRRRWPRSTPRRRSRGRRRCRPTRCGGSPATSRPSGGSGASSRPARATSASPAPTRSPTTRCRCCSAPTKSTGRSSACGCCTSRVVFMLGPEANHFVTVGHPENFHWRESSFGDLIPLLGDGLLTIDDDYHDRARAIMLPAFHREQIAAAVGGDGERGRARRSPALPAGEVVDVYDWMRNLAMRIAMRALLGLDPDEAGKGAAAAEHFERALGYYGIDYGLRLLRGPGSPWRKLIASRAGPRRDRLRRDRPPPRRPRPRAARTSSASWSTPAARAARRFSDREIRDQVMTLMFAGHDTSTSTLTFMLHELARHPDVLATPARGAGPGAGRRARRRRRSSNARCPTSTWCSTRCCASTRRPGSARAGRSASSSSAATRCPAAPTSTTAPGPATASPRSSPTPRPSSPSASPASARRRCRAAPTSPSAAARGSASASASARPR